VGLFFLLRKIEFYLSNLSLIPKKYDSHHRPLSEKAKSHEMIYSSGLGYKLHWKKEPY